MTSTLFKGLGLMKIMIISYSDPFDGSDRVWNTLRIAAFEKDLGNDVWVFLLGDSVKLVHPDRIVRAGLPLDVNAEFAAALAAGVVFKACGTCLKNRDLAFDAVLAGVEVATLKDHSDWLKAADRVLTF